MAFPGDPGPGVVLSGCTVWSGSAGVASGIDWMDTATGVPHVLSRTYSTNGNGWNWSQVDADIAAQRIPFHTSKFTNFTNAQIVAGSADAALATQASNAISRAPYPLWLGFYHEPEDNFESDSSAAGFRAAARYIVQYMRNAGVTNVAWVFPVWMASWSFRGGEASRGPAYKWDIDWKGTLSGAGKPNASDWYTGSQSMTDLLGFDQYTPWIGGSGYHTFDYDIGYSLDRLYSEWGRPVKPCAIGECGTKDAASPTPNWTTHFSEMLDSCVELDVRGLVYYNTDLNNFVNADPTGERFAGYNAMVHDPRVGNIDVPGTPASAPGGGVVTYLGRVLAEAQDPTGTSWSFNFSSSVAAGNFLIGSFALDGNSSVLPTLTITDTAGNSYDVAASVLSGSTVSTTIFSGHVTNAITAATDLLITSSADRSRAACSVEAYDDAIEAVPLDRTATNTGASATPSGGTTAATTTADQLIFAAFGFGGGRTFTAGAGFTSSGAVSTTIGSSDRATANEWKLVSATGAQSATGTLSSSSTYSGAIATFKIAAPPAPTNWYVDSSVGTSGNGLSWATAWKNLSNIVWASVQPGDTIYLSGGTTTKTYAGTMLIAASGSVGNPITITRGVDTNHDGTPIIDGTNTVAWGISNGRAAEEQHYITVRGLSVRNFTSGCFGLGDTIGFTAEDCEVLCGSTTGAPRAFDVRSTTDTVLRNNTVTTPASTAGQTDGIYSQDNQDFLYENNTITISNTNGTGHSDAFQQHLDGSGVVRNNIFMSPTSAADNKVVWIHAILTGETVDFYNNVCISRGGQHNVSYWRELDASPHGTLRIWNNTIVGGGRSVNLERVTNLEIRNNIVWPDAAGYGVYSNLADPATSAVTYNLVWAPSATVALTNAAGPRTWAQWIAAGFNANGKNVDPQFVNKAANDLHLLGSSPAIDAGVTIATVVTDIDGTPRPLGAAYDIGAYEILATATIVARRRTATGWEVIAPDGWALKLRTALGWE